MTSHVEMCSPKQTTKARGHSNEGSPKKSALQTTRWGRSPTIYAKACSSQVCHLDHSLGPGGLRSGFFGDHVTHMSECARAQTRRHFAWELSSGLSSGGKHAVTAVDTGEEMLHSNPSKWRSPVWLCSNVLFWCAPVYELWEHPARSRCQHWKGGVVVCSGAYTSTGGTLTSAEHSVISWMTHDKSFIQKYHNCQTMVLR